MATEHYEGCVNMKFHPHWLTGAKGFETSYNQVETYEFQDDDEEFEDLLAAGSCQIDDNHFRDSDKLESLSEISNESTEVQKLALYTEEDDENSINIVNVDLSWARNINTLNSRLSVLNQPDKSYMFKANIKEAQQELEMVLLQSPPKLMPANVENPSEMEKLDNEILLTTESNEYELEEYSIFNQGANDQKMYQWLFKNGNLLKKQKLRKRKPLGMSRTSIKQNNTFSSQSLSKYGNKSMTKSLTKPQQRSSTLLKQKVKEIANKMSGKKTHLRNKSRNFESTLIKNKTSQKELESIPEFNNQLKRNYYFRKN